MTNHPELEQLSAFVDGELSDPEIRHLEEHVPACAECTHMLGALRATLADLRALAEPVLDDAGVAALDDRIAVERATRKSFARRWGVVSGAAAAAIVALVVFVGVVKPDDRGGTAALHNADQSGGGTALLATGTNYTEESLTQALIALAPAVQEAAPASGGARNFSVTPAVTDAFGYSQYDATAGDAGLTTCRREVEGADADVSFVRAESARFKDQPAYVLFYTRPRENPTHAEVWVVRPSDCFTLYYAQSRI